MQDNRTLRGQASRSVRRTGGLAAESARLVLRVVLAFTGVTAALVLAGVAYTFIGGRRFDLRVIPAWFLRLSIEQWIGLGGGLAVAALVVAVPCSKITARRGPGRELLTRPKKLVQNLTVVTVLLLYALGAGTAYHISLALHHSRDWAIIHSEYSWVYVGFSVSAWIGDHRKQPLGETLREFRRAAGM